MIGIQLLRAMPVQSTMRAGCRDCDDLHRLPGRIAKEQARNAEFYRLVVSRQHPDHDIDVRPPPEGQP